MGPVARQGRRPHDGRPTTNEKRRRFPPKGGRNPHERPPRPSQRPPPRGEHASATSSLVVGKACGRARSRGQAARGSAARAPRAAPTWAPVRLACAARHCHAAAARLPFPFWSGFGGPCSPGAHCAGWRRPLLWVARGAALLRRHSGVPHTCTQSPPPVALGQRFWAPRRAPRENVRLEGVGMVCREPPVAPRGGRAAPRRRGGGAAAARLPTGA